VAARRLHVCVARPCSRVCVCVCAPGGGGVAVCVCVCAGREREWRVVSGVLAASKQPAHPYHTAVAACCLHTRAHMRAHTRTAAAALRQPRCDALARTRPHLHAWPVAQVRAHKLLGHLALNLGAFVATQPRGVRQQQPPRHACAHTHTHARTPRMQLHTLTAAHNAPPAETLARSA
jgi:hypothetical protein